MPFRYAVKALIRQGRFTFAVALVFALGIGANVAIFAMFDRLLFRPLPYREADRLVHIYAATAKSTSSAIMPLQVTQALAREPGLFSGVAWADGNIRSTTIDDGSVPLALTGVTSNAMSLLGVAPVLGRSFVDGDNSTAASSMTWPILLTYETWQARFGSDRGVVGRGWHDARGDYRIIGVLPRGFMLPTSRLVSERYDGIYPVAGYFDIRVGLGDFRVAPFGRLMPGVTLDNAQAHIDAIMSSRFARFRPPGASAARRPVILQPMRSGLMLMVGSYLWLVTGTVWTLLAATCLSMAVLLFMRGQTRLTNFGVHLALGASPATLGKMALAEALVLGTIGTALGWVTYVVAASSLRLVVPVSLRSFGAPATDVRIAVMTVVGGCLAALVAGVSPAMAAARSDVLTILHPERRRSNRSRIRPGAIMLTLQASFGAVLLVGALLTVPTFVALLMRANPGDAANLFVVETTANADDESLSSAFGMARVRRVVDAARGLPGVLAAGATVPEPFTSGIPQRSAFWDRHGAVGEDWAVGDGFFEAVSATVIAGRSFSERDMVERGRVAIINEVGVSTLWPDVSAVSVVGRTIDTDTGARQIVGVVSGFRVHPSVSAEPALFIPITSPEVPPTQAHLSVLLRVEHSQYPNVATLNDRLGETARVISVADRWEPLLEQPRFLAILCGTLAVVTLILVGVCTYALCRLDLDRRQREIGIRLSFGALPRRLGQQLFLSSAGPVVAGLLLSLPVDIAIAHALSAAGARPAMSWPTACVGALVIMVIVARVVLWRPIRHATTSDPSVLLRNP